MIRWLTRTLAKRRLARMCRENMARIAAGPPRHRNGRFARKSRIIA